jgi:23S rRNA-intervening sequence protein
MKQDENDQNHNQEPTPVVGKNPNGKSQIASFTHKIDEALGEAMETQAWLDHCLDCDCITSVQHRQLDAAWQSIGAILYRMMERAENFCQKPCH